MVKIKRQGGRGARAEGVAQARRQASLIKGGATAAVIILIAAILLAGGGPGGSGGDVSVEGRAAPGGTSPAVHLVDFDGEPLALADYRGTPVVLNFWASWCPSCIAEMPAFENVHRDLKGQVVFLGIDQRDDRGAAEELARRTGVTYRLAEDSDGLVFDAFGAVGMPTTVFIDANGDVIDVVAGELNEELLRDYIADSFGIDAGA